MATTADVVRMQRIIDELTALGVRVYTIKGWENKGKDWARVPVGLLVHHDASSAKSGETGSLGVIVAGRSDVPGPLAQFQIHRCADGIPALTVVAAGRANHAGTGGPLVIAGRTVPANTGNSWCYGAEAANDGIKEDYTSAAMHAHYALGVAVMRVLSVGTDGIVLHRTWAPTRKIDARFDLDRFRESVAALAAGGSFLNVLNDQEQADLFNRVARMEEVLNNLATVPNWPNDDGTEGPQETRMVIRHAALTAQAASANSSALLRRTGVMLGLNEPREAEAAALAKLWGEQLAAPAEFDYEALARAILKVAAEG